MAFFCIGISCLPIDQFKKAERNSVLSVEARRILTILADRPADTIATDENGRPFFRDAVNTPGAGNVDFSISHSGSAVAVSLVQGENIYEARARTGCDIQLIRPRKNLRNIAENYFSAAERDYILQQNDIQLECARFFQIWTLKECYIKLRGLSVFDLPKAPSFISCDAAGRNPFASNAGGSSPLSFYLYELAHSGDCYMLAAVVDKVSIGDQDSGICPEIRMFSGCGKTLNFLGGSRSIYGDFAS